MPDRSGLPAAQSVEQRISDPRFSRDISFPGERFGVNDENVLGFLQ